MPAVWGPVWFPFWGQILISTLSPQGIAPPPALSPKGNVSPEQGRPHWAPSHFWFSSWSAAGFCGAQRLLRTWVGRQAGAGLGTTHGPRDGAGPWTTWRSRTLASPRSGHAHRDKALSLVGCLVQRLCPACPGSSAAGHATFGDSHDK